MQLSMFSVPLTHNSRLCAIVPDRADNALERLMLRSRIWGDSLSQLESHWEHSFDEKAAKCKPANKIKCWVQHDNWRSALV